MEVEKKFKMAMETISWAVGFVDTVAVHASSVYDSGRLFADGIGDVSVLDESEEVIRRACLGLSGIPYLTNLVWEDRPATSKVNGAYTVEEATFDAPFPHFLPKECHRAHFQLVRPTKGPVKGVVIHFQMTGDETFDFRRDAIANRLVDSQTASILVMIPMYGSRRPPGQERFLIRTVSEFFQASIVAMFEGAMLVSWARKQFPAASVCITGISAGAVPATGAALLTKEPVALVPCIAPCSGRPFIFGALAAWIDWKNIAKSIGAKNIAQAQLYMVELFARKHIRKMVEWRKESKQALTLVTMSIAAMHDRCVHPVESQELHDMLAEISTHSEMAWMPGGHILAIRQSGTRFAPIIQRAVDVMNTSEALSS